MTNGFFRSDPPEFCQREWSDSIHWNFAEESDPIRSDSRTSRTICNNCPFWATYEREKWKIVRFWHFLTIFGAKNYNWNWFFKHSKFEFLCQTTKFHFLSFLKNLNYLVFLAFFESKICFLITKLLESRNFQIPTQRCVIKCHFDNRMQRKPPKLEQFSLTRSLKENENSLIQNTICPSKNFSGLSKSL